MNFGVNRYVHKQHDAPKNKPRIERWVDSSGGKRLLRPQYWYVPLTLSEKAIFLCMRTIGFSVPMIQDSICRTCNRQSDCQRIYSTKLYSVIALPRQTVSASTHARLGRATMSHFLLKIEDRLHGSILRPIRSYPFSSFFGNELNVRKYLAHD